MVEMARAGIKAVGFDVSEKRCAMVAAGRSPVEDVPTPVLKKFVKEGLISVAKDWRELKKMDAISICVPTPLRKSKEPDISFVHQASSDLAKHLQPGQLIILESTTYPGTTREILLPILEATGLKCGKDFSLAFSPERVDPGNVTWPLNRIPKVIGGITESCTKRAVEFYGRVFETVHPVSNAEAAEMAKLLENTFRAVNIGLANEFALACDLLGIDTWEVVDAAATKPFGFMPFRPGPGLGGHCIPIDPHYLSWKMRLLNFSTRFINLADDINSNMPRHVVLSLAMALNKRRVAFSQAKILVIGLAYKPDVSDVRESPAFDIIDLLERHGAKISYHDELVPTATICGKTVKSTPLTPSRLKTFDAALIVTPHSGIDIKSVCRHSQVVYDCRGVTTKIRRKNIIRL